MERKNADDPNSAIKKGIERQKLKTRNQISQQRDNIIPDTFALEEKNQT